MLKPISQALWPWLIFLSPPLLGFMAFLVIDIIAPSLLSAK